MGHAEQVWTIAHNSPSSPTNLQLALFFNVDS